MLVARDGSVATVTFNRPAARNAMTFLEKRAPRWSDPPLPPDPRAAGR
jgi:enoyl-CoA hydratase/carnithine racemase